MTPRRHLVPAVTFAAVAAAGAAAAQSLPLETERARALLLEGAPPIAGFSAQAPVLEDGWRLVTFYAPSDDDGPVMAGVSPRRFVARRAVGGPTGVEVQWTAEERCPTLRGVLGWMSELSAPTLFVSGIDARFSPAAGGPPVNIPTHAVSYRLWGRGFAPDGSLAAVEVEGSGGALADCGAAAERSLAPCWESGPPPEVAR